MAQNYAESNINNHCRHLQSNRMFGAQWCVSERWDGRIDKVPSAVLSKLALLTHTKSTVRLVWFEVLKSDLRHISSLVTQPLIRVRFRGLGHETKVVSTIRPHLLSSAGVVDVGKLPRHHAIHSKSPFSILSLMLGSWRPPTKEMESSSRIT